MAFDIRKVIFKNTVLSRIRREDNDLSMMLAAPSSGELSVGWRAVPVTGPPQLAESHFQTTWACRGHVAGCYCLPKSFRAFRFAKCRVCPSYHARYIFKREHLTACHLSPCYQGTCMPRLLQGGVCSGLNGVSLSTYQLGKEQRQMWYIRWP